MADTGSGAIEKRISRLEQIVARLEREELELDEALRLFEEGIGHLREVRGMLRDAELQVERLVEEADGSLATEPFHEE
ncbi:MAG TPA: exodeoxyribonuclease VII small subunit [Longimicrobiales bacterium]|nr:exodeoxyribonuclease VII small subunit [Longimicrobiales bacterium]